MEAVILVCKDKSATTLFHLSADRGSSLVYWYTTSHSQPALHNLHSCTVLQSTEWFQ